MSIKTYAKIFGVMMFTFILSDLTEYYVMKEQPYNRIPRDIRIKENFVQPSKLEIELKDLDKDGKNETLINYDGKSYLLKIDDAGKPIINSYGIEPFKIISKH